MERRIGETREHARVCGDGLWIGLHYRHVRRRHDHQPDHLVFHLGAGEQDRQMDIGGIFRDRAVVDAEQSQQSAWPPRPLAGHSDHHHRHSGCRSLHAVPSRCRRVVQSHAADRPRDLPLKAGLLVRRSGNSRKAGRKSY